MKHHTMYHRQLKLTSVISVNTVEWSNSSSSSNSIYHKSFVCIQFKCQTVIFQAIQFIISHLSAFSLNVKQFYLTQRQDLIWCYHSRWDWTWDRWQWRTTLYYPKIQGWKLTIRLFWVIIRTLVQLHGF